MGYLGPDLLGPDWDPAEAERRVASAPDVPIGVALLDQRNLAGIGNIYRCEVCFLAGNPPGVARLGRDGSARHVRRCQAASRGQPRTRPPHHRAQCARYAGGPGRRPSRLLGLPARAPACLRCRTPIRRGVLGNCPGRRRRSPRSATSTSAPNASRSGAGSPDRLPGGRASAPRRRRSRVVRSGTVASAAGPRLLRASLRGTAAWAARLSVAAGTMKRGSRSWTRGPMASA